MKKLLALILLISISLANVYVISPVENTVTQIDHSDYEEHITYLKDSYLGKIGPGQRLDLKFSRDADETFMWNSVEVLECDYNCQVEITDDYFQVSLQLPINEPEGMKKVKLQFKNDLDLRTTEIVSFVFDATKENLYTFDVTDNLQVFAGDPQPVWFSITSNSISTDELILGDFEDFPAAWSHSGTIQVMPGQTQMAKFDMNALDEGIYDLTFQLSSTTGAVLGQQSLQLRVFPTLKSKFRIYSEGFAFIPAILQPFYSLLSWFGLVF